jgi:hypothetical protein
MQSTTAEPRAKLCIWGDFTATIKKQDLKVNQGTCGGRGTRIGRCSRQNVREFDDEVKLREILNVRKNIELNCCLQ